MTERLYYDGECPMCLIGAKVLRVRGLEIEAFPEPELEECRGEMKLVSGGRVYSGADALREVLRKWSWTRPIAWFMPMPIAHAIYRFVSRNRRVIAPTSRNVRLPRTFYGETAGSTLVFLAVTLLAATLLTLAYGASVGPLVGLGRADAALRVTLAAAAGWTLSMPILFFFGWRQVAPSDILRHVTATMAAGALLLVPITLVNWLEASALANGVVLVCVGLFLLGMMTWRLKLYGLRPWMSAAWFALLEAGGLAMWLAGR